MKTNGKNVKRYLKCLPNAVAVVTHTHKVNENIFQANWKKVENKQMHKKLYSK